MTKRSNLFSISVSHQRYKSEFRANCIVIKETVKFPFLLDHSIHFGECKKAMRLLFLDMVCRESFMKYI